MQMFQVRPASVLLPIPTTKGVLETMIFDRQQEHVDDMPAHVGSSAVNSRAYFHHGCTENIRPVCI
jgi:hypothetical protein